MAFLYQCCRAAAFASITLEFVYTLNNRLICEWRSGEKWFVLWLGSVDKNTEAHGDNEKESTRLDHQVRQNNVYLAETT